MTMPLEKAANIRLLALDVDGVLTNGQLLFDSLGTETKCFHIHDGLGIKLAQNNGIEVAIITGRQSQAVSQRASELGIQRVVQGREDKAIALEELRQQLQLNYQQIAYMGDDLPDLPAIRKAGLGITVANGHPWVVKHADWQTRKCGGEGAVREACELILQAQDKLQQCLDNYL